jgi:hypothetical protein
MRRLKISDNIYKDGVIVTADTGFASEANMQYLHDKGIAGYIPDNQFRSRDPKFADQKIKYGKRNQQSKNKPSPEMYAASEFQLDPVNKTCVCPAGEDLWLRKEGQ